MSLSLLLLLIPFLGGLAVFSAGKAAKALSLGVALVNFGVFALALNGFQPTAAFQFVYEQAWMPELGITFKLGLDGINLIPMLLTTLLVPIIIAAAKPDDYRHQANFFALILLMQAALSIVFLARTAFLFYLGWEAALIPVFFLSGIWGGEGRQRVTLKFFIYTVAGGLFMLVGLIYLYTKTSAPDRDDFDIIAGAGRVLDAHTQGWVFWALFIAFAIKMPIFPFHTWQPDLYASSPAPATMLLSGIMLKMGIYGVARWLLPVVPLGVEQYKEIVILLAVAGIVYGSVIAIMQSDLKRVVAYSSLAHVGLMAAALFSGTTIGVTGALLQMLSHGVTVVGLFLVVEQIERSTGRRELGTLGGLTADSPSLSVYFVLMLLGSVALPLTSGFVGEYMMLLGLSELNIYLASVAGLTVIFSAVYMLRMYQLAMLGPRVNPETMLKPMTLAINVSFIALAIMVFWIGIFPNSFLSLLQPSVTNLLHAAGR